MATRQAPGQLTSREPSSPTGTGALLSAPHPTFRPLQSPPELGLGPAQASSLALLSVSTAQRPCC